MDHETDIWHPSRYTTALFLSLLVAGCSHEIPQHSAQTVRTPQFGSRSLEVPQHVAKPSTNAPTMVAQPQESSLPITLQGDLTMLENSLKQAVPTSLDESTHPLGKDFRWTFTRVEDPDVSIRDGRLFVHAKYKGDLEARSAGTSGTYGCHLEPLYPVLEWNGQLGTKLEAGKLLIGMVNPDLAVNLAPESDVKCNMFNKPLPEILKELIATNEVKGVIPSAVDQTQLFIPMEQIWAGLHGPYASALAPFNVQLCIYPDPSDLMVERMEGSLKQVTLHAKARVHAVALLEHACHATRVAPHRVATRVSSGTTPFRILTIVPVVYTNLSQKLQERLFHKEFTLTEEGMFQKRLTIENVSAADANGNILVTVVTRGYLNGSIYYWGTPTFADASTITIPDLQMSLESRKTLEAMGPEIWKAIDSKMTPAVRQAAKLELNDLIGKIKTGLTGQHRREEVVLDMAVSNLQPKRAYSTPQAIVAELAAEGTVQATAGLNVQSHDLKPLVPSPPPPPVHRELERPSPPTGL